MRKTLFTLAGLLVTIIANAYTCVTFNSGDPSILLKEANISYEFDWDHARITNHDNLLWHDYLKKRGDDFVKDWPKDRKKVEEYFTVRFNKKSDFLQIKDKSPVYKMIVHPKTIDVGNGGSAFNPWASSKAGGCIINGTIDFCDAATGKVLCVLNIVEGKGTGHPSETTRLGVALMEVAGDIWDFVEDEVEKGKVKGTPISGQAAATTTTVATTTAKKAAETDGTTAATAKAATTTTTTAKTTATKTTAATSKTTAKATTAATTRATTTSSDNSNVGGTARVVMKNGSVLTGRVKAFDPTQSITLVVAGITTTIPMSEVQTVESQDGGTMATGGSSTSTTQVAEASAAPVIGGSLGNQKLIITDSNKYPASIKLNIGGQVINLLLVRGGRMNMGYDGDGSRKMKSEPIHEVALTSYYMSDKPLPASVAIQLIGEKDVDGKGNEPAQLREFDDAQKLVNKIAAQTGLPYRLPTEAEWEFAASGNSQNEIFRLTDRDYIYYEWCSDYHDDYPDDRAVLTDPIGPSYGEEHVVRSFNCDRGKYDRSNKVDEDDAYVGLVRLVIKAKDIK